MSCANHCFEIGGPWIAEDPNCPIHGQDAQDRETRQLERDDEVDARISQLVSIVADLLARVYELEKRVGILGP